MTLTHTTTVDNGTTITTTHYSDGSALAVFSSGLIIRHTPDGQVQLISQ